MKCSRCSAQATVEIIKESATGRDSQRAYLCGDCRNADVWDWVNWIKVTETPLQTTVQTEKLANQHWLNNISNKHD